MGLPVNKPCPCGSGKKYKKCCGIFHNGSDPKTALELMKSRYSAFCVNDAKYIIKTTHKENSDFSDDIEIWKKSILEFSKNTNFEALSIISFDTITQNEAYVTFHAKLSTDSNDISFTEKSKFLKEDNIWKYHSGEINDDQS